MKGRWGNKGASSSSDESTEPDKISEVQQAIDASKDQVQVAIHKTIERGDRMEDIQDKAEVLQTDAGM